MVDNKSVLYYNMDMLKENVMSLGTCPACNGTGHMPCPDRLRDGGQKYGWYGYRAEDDTVACTNCGAQTMYGRASGQVLLRPDGTPCLHEYESRTIGRCLTRYTCKHCQSSYEIDSGD
jgi:hypothetical protein